MPKKTIYGTRGDYNGNASEHPLYFRWMNMLRRCYEPTFDGYSSYGGRGVSVEPYLKIENAGKRIPVYKINHDGNKEYYPSITEAEKKTGIWRGNIARAIKKGYMAGGFRWGCATCGEALD